MTQKNFDPNVDYQRSRMDHTGRKFQSLNLPDLTGKRYLDLGCNSGAFCQLALEHGAAQVAGVDIDPRLIAIARENIPQGEFFVFRFEEIDLEHRQFDVITIASAIHYSQNFLVVAQRIFKMLAPGGLLVIEGGLFDPMANTRLNTPVPNWRQIGDHCRHLSMNFLDEILFPNSHVSLVGPSLQQGGDNLSRYAVHVHYAPGELSLDKRPATVDLEGFIRALAVSYDTVQAKYPMSNHMEALKRTALLGLGNYDKTFKPTPEIIGLIAGELIYCTSDWASEITILDGYGSDTGRQIAEALQAKGVVARTATR